MHKESAANSANEIISHVKATITMDLLLINSFESPIQDLVKVPTSIGERQYRLVQYLEL